MQRSRFERLVAEHKNAVYRQMTRVCSGREDAEDALATALMLAFQSVDQLKDDGSFRAWLSIIGRRVCSRMRQHSGIELVWEYAQERDFIEMSVSAFEIEVLKGCVKQAVDQLPEKYRDIYMLCDLEEHTLAEAATQLRITESAAKSRLYRARTIVRDLLDRSICAR